MTTVQNEGRRAKRIPLALPVRVEAQEEKGVFWRAITHLINVSAFGAGFYVNQKLAVGQVILLTIPLPRGLRCFDHTDEQYRVWSIVRHCNVPTDESFSGYHIGVAFIGKRPPASYVEDPQRLYKISGVSGDGMWQIGEDSRPKVIRQFERYSIPLNVYLAVFDRHENLVAHEQTVTENISRGGAAVFSSLPVKIGDIIKFGSDQFDSFLTAEVCNQRTGQDGLPRLHLRFINEEFPLQGIEQN